MLAEGFSLLAAGALDGGLSARRTEVGMGIAGALLLSHALEGRASVHRGTVHLAGHRPRPVSSWVRTQADEAYETVLCDLLRSGALTPVRRRGNRFLPRELRELYEPVDHASYEHRVTAVRHALFGYPPPNRNGALLASLLYATGICPALFSQLTRRQLKSWTVLEETLSTVCDQRERELVAVICEGVENALSARVQELQLGR